MLTHPAKFHIAPVYSFVLSVLLLFFFKKQKMPQALLRQMIRFINELDRIWKRAVLAGWTKENNDKSQKRLSICRVLTRLMQSKGANSRG